MSHQVLKRKAPLGAGLEAHLAAVRSQDKTPLQINHPSEDADTLAAEGDTFTFDSFTTEDAWELGHFLHAKLSRTRATLVSISLTNGLVLFQTTTGSGVKPDNETWVARKRRSVLRWGSSTWMLHCRFRGDEDDFASRFCMSRDQAGQYAIHGGAVPIYVRGVEGVVAVVVVSGLAQHEDHGVIVDAVKENWVPVD